jgi:histidinol-phosphate aminotransferase
MALEQLQDAGHKDAWVKKILEQRLRLQMELKDNSMVQHILPSDANFLMVKFRNARMVFDYLIASRIIVRDRSKVPLCEGYLRITVGTAEENTVLLEALKELSVKLKTGKELP